MHFYARTLTGNSCVWVESTSPVLTAKNAAGSWMLLSPHRALPPGSRGDRRGPSGSSGSSLAAPEERLSHRETDCYCYSYCYYHMRPNLFCCGKKQKQNKTKKTQKNKDTDKIIIITTPQLILCHGFTGGTKSEWPLSCCPCLLLSPSS